MESSRLFTLLSSYFFQVTPYYNTRDSVETKTIEQKVFHTLLTVNKVSYVNLVSKNLMIFINFIIARQRE